MTQAPTRDSDAFCYTEFFEAYGSIPYIKGLIELSGSSLVLPSDYSIKDPLHICLGAIHGHYPIPPSGTLAKESVKNDSVYPKTVRTRKKLFEDAVDEFNALEREIGPFKGGNLRIEIDDKPLTQDEFEAVGLGDFWLARAAEQYNRDRKFETLNKHTARLNHFAGEYGFKSFNGLLNYIECVDTEAKTMGYPSFFALCTPSQYLDYQIKLHGDYDDLIRELNEKYKSLIRQSTFIIEQFVACRIPNANLPFHVDINDEDVLIELHEGRFKGTGIVNSIHLSSKNPKFHDEWFGKLPGILIMQYADEAQSLPCPICHGRGTDVEVICPDCHGTGYAPLEDTPFAQCLTCYGDGEITLDNCPNCGGEGFIDEDEQNTD